MVQDAQSLTLDIWFGSRRGQGWTFELPSTNQHTYYENDDPVREVRKVSLDQTRKFSVATLARSSMRSKQIPGPDDTMIVLLAARLSCQA